MAYTPTSGKIASLVDKPHGVGVGRSGEDEEGEEGKKVKDDAISNRLAWKISERVCDLFGFACTACSSVNPAN